MKSILLVALFFMSQKVTAFEESEIVFKPAANQTTSEFEGFTAQGMVSYSPFIDNVQVGPALSYQISDRGHLGGRTLFSMGSPNNQGSYLMEAFWREDLNTRDTRIYVEPSFGLNFVNYKSPETRFSEYKANTYTSTQFPSFGLSFGVINFYSPEFSFGAATGIEVAVAENMKQTALITIADNVHLAPRVSVVGNYHF